MRRQTVLGLLCTVALFAACGDSTDTSDGGDGSANVGDGPLAQVDLRSPDGDAPPNPDDGVAVDDGIAHDLRSPVDLAHPDLAHPDLSYTGHPVRAGACPTAVVPSPGNQIPHMKGATCAQLGYYDFTPAAYDTGNNWPLIIAFHGDGQRGNGTTELSSLLGDGLTADIANNQWDPTKRFVVLTPQMDDRGLPERTSGYVNAFIQFAIANYDVDIHRVYLTGLSGGGAPVYNYMADYSGAGIAATAIMSGWYSTQGQECKWKDVPIWYFHGAMDNLVDPPSHATKSYNTLVACVPAPATAPKYTLWAGIGHGAWQPAYQLLALNVTTSPYDTTAPGTTPYNVSLYDWFLSYTH